MWFRNLQLFRLTNAWSHTADTLAQALASKGFKPCGALDRQAQGWVPPRGEEGELVFANGRQILLALGVEQKLLPTSVIRQYAQERTDAIESEQGYKPGRAQAREIFEAVEAELLPKALVKRRLTYVWIDPVGGWLVVDAASPAKADEVIEHLKLSLGELPLTLLKTLQAPGTAMTTWLSLGEAAVNFSIDQDCELRSPGDTGGTVRYAKHPLDTAEIRQHIGNGKLVSRLAMTWSDRISFVLTEQLQIKRLAFLDVLREQAEQAGEGDDAFIADFTIMAGELAHLLADLTIALGGESS